MSQEPFDVRAGEPGQAADLWVGSGQVLGEHDQAVGAQVHGGGPERGGDGGQVAQRGRADAGLADRLNTLGDGRLAWPGHAWWLLADPQLIAGLVEAEHAGRVMHPGVVTGAGRLRQSPGEAGEVAVVELAEGLAGGQADQGKPAPGHIPGPVRAPPEPLSYFGDPLNVAGVAGTPLPVKAAGVLGEQQIQIRNKMPFGETPGHELPRPGAIQVGQPRWRRPSHPRRQMRMNL